MDRTATHETQVPFDSIPAAETRETNMTSRPRSVQLRRWVGAAALSVALCGIPLVANARPYEPSDIPQPEGDPTADDQPSPTPKPKRAAGISGPRRMTELNGFRAHERGRIFWLSVARTWIRIAIR